MTVNRTTLLDLPLPVTGTESGTWGDTTNNGLTQYLDIAIAGTLVLSTDADVTLTSTEGDSSATNIGATTAQYAILRWTATGSTTRNITALAQSKTYVVINATGGTQSIVLRGAGPTTGVTIISGEKALCVWNGSDFVKVSSSAAAGGSNTQVQYNSSGVLAGSSNMTFNGTKLTVAGFLDSALTSGRVPYATTSGELIDSANLLYSGTDLTVYGITVGRGAGAVGTNTAVGASALAGHTSGAFNVAVGANAALNATTIANATVVGMNAIGTGIATGTYITAIGTSALQKLTSGSYITGVGVLALKENTTGSYNTALGVEALQANTTASNNTAVGYQAGYTQTIGNGQNTYLGYRAGYLVTGERIVAIGSNAGYGAALGNASTVVGESAGYNSTGANNTFFGNAAGYGTASTGNGNTAIGALSGYALTSGQANTFVGSAESGSTESSGRRTTSGSYNVAVGSAALSNNTTGASNTAVGYQAGYSNTAADNTFVGWRAGYSNTTGTPNTYIGVQAGYNTTGSINTFVGQSSGYFVTTGSKNTILGAYTGNQGGLDIRTANNYIVLSDGDGNPRGIFNGSGDLTVGSTGFDGRVTIQSAAGSIGLSLLNSSGNRRSICLPDATYGYIWALSVPSNGTTAWRFEDAVGGYAGGIIVNSGSVNYSSASDYRLKENIQPMTGALAKVAALKPCTYNLKADGSVRDGFIAHELAEVCPDAVTGKKDAVDANGKPVYQGVDTSLLVATLTAAIQELKAEVDGLKAQLNKV